MAIGSGRSQARETGEGLRLCVAVRDRLVADGR
jgi:hypothetical protein